jgi:hypothetical protein
VPRIPDATSLGERRVAAGRAPTFQDRSGEIAAGAIGRASHEIGAAVESFAAHDDQFNFARAKSSLLSADMDARKTLENDPDWGSYGKRYTEAMSRAREKAVELIRGRRSKAIFDSDAQLDIERGAGEIRGVSRRKEVDWGRASLGEMLNSNRSAALSAADEGTRTAFVRSSQDAIQGALDKQYISAQEAVSQRKSWTESYASGYLDTLPFAKQVEVLKEPQGTPANFLSPDVRANALRQAENQVRIERERAEAEQKSKLVEVRQSLTDQLRDIMAGAQLGLPVNVPSRSVLQAAFGEREGAQRYDIAISAAKLSGDIAALQQLPSADIAAKVESYKPTQTEGAADQGQIYGMVANSARAILKERQDDPAGYLTQHAPSTQKAWAAFQSDEGARDAYFAAIEADRERLGLPKGDILPNAYAKSLTDEINNPKSAEQLASLMGDLAEQWGDRWPDVHAQIAKDLPDMAAVIGSGIDRSAAVTLASTAKLKDKELEAMLPPSVKWGDVQADVASAFDEVRRSFPAEGARTYQAIHDSATRLAVSYMQAGSSKENAIGRAYRELIGSQYEIGEVKDVPFLIPRQFDAGDVEDEAQRLIDDFKPTPDMIAVPVGEDPARFLERATKTMREDAYWVARGDGQGVRMYMGARPTSISYDFQQLSDMAQARRANDQQSVKRLREQALRSRSSN